MTYPQALDVAICFGWIDARKASLDETHWLQKFSPRGPRSRWSKVNRAKAQALIAAGRMRPAGLAEVERAKRQVASRPRTPARGRETGDLGREAR